MTQKKKPIGKPKATAPKPKPRATSKTARPSNFPIVAIGASAGGLEALELFLAHVPPNSGMAFVIVQHLDPTYKGMLVELLQRGTPMPVLQINDRTRVKPNGVYVIPPNKDLSILRGVLHLLDPRAPRGLRLPIDFFFRAVAEDQQEHSIGVILSGMGSDGLLGARAIKEKGGVVLVQAPASAKFEGMPQSTIQAGLADVIAPVEELPQKLHAYLQHTPLLPEAHWATQPAAHSALAKVVLLLRAQTGHDFALYKTTTLYRRIERRMGLHQIDKIANYVRFLQETPAEVDLLFHELLIGVTSFFRDPEAWAHVQAEVWPTLLAGADPHPTLRAWVPACSTGEEAYSLAILFKEALAELKPARPVTLQIFATDLDQQAIEQARAGVFPANITADVSAERLKRFFVKVEAGYQVSKTIREMIIFAPQNLTMDPPFTKLDLISCRNLLIYLTPELQKKLLALWHYSLNPNGFLFLGNAETVGNLTSLFAPLDGKKARLYRRLSVANPAARFDFPTHFASPPPGAVAPPAPVNIQELAERWLLRHYAPAAVLTNRDGDILYISGHTGPYLEPAAGKANWNIFVMARESLRSDLTTAFLKVVRQNAPFKLEHLGGVPPDGPPRVDITLQPLGEATALTSLILIVFTETGARPAPPPAGPAGRVTPRQRALEQELAQAYQATETLREAMQTAQEELKSANEELQSTNEELQSTNEELQSTNEELTTSKEELQSMNEELHTVNQELQTRLTELTHTGNDLKNLLDSTDIATLFLDNDLRVRRFTSALGKLTRLLPTDAGRPITDIASDVLYPELADDAREVLRTLVKTERELRAPTGSWFMVRVLPYRTLDNRIDGVVLTFADITLAKQLEAELRRQPRTP